jgi:hypothetical protein
MVCFKIGHNNEVFTTLTLIFLRRPTIKYCKKTANTYPLWYRISTEQAVGCVIYDPHISTNNIYNKGFT